jgi:uncharacterized lipoprotein YddW (UPF0748 family)
VTRGLVRCAAALLSGAAACVSLAQGWTATTEAAFTPPAPMREFRGAWVATVANIDWPSKPGLPVSAMRQEMTRLLDAAADANLNAIVLQVRPACDAIYPSALEPWSEFLTGEAGKAPAEAIDPLAEWIREAHARGMELHAWINPFRARHFESKTPNASGHVANTHPAWVKTYGEYQWLDPGIPEARAHTLAVVDDLLARYDLDGVHFDDYFYPYPKPGVAFPDDESFGAYTRSGGTLARDAWRRSNIDVFVKDLYQRVKRQKPGVKVGISPFGIWRPGRPPQARGFDAFEGLHADARRWVREGWMDYVSPQLYWKLEAPQQPYRRLLDWWIDQNDQGRHVWPGLYASRVLAAGAKEKDGKPAPSWAPTDVIGQIEATRAAGFGPGIGGTGNVHFSMVAIAQNRRGLADELKAGPYANPALVPESPWLAPRRVGAPGKSDTMAAPVAAITDDSRGTVVRVTLPADPGASARWVGVWTRRSDAKEGAGAAAIWALRVQRVVTPLGQAIPPGGAFEVVLPHGSGSTALRGTAVFVVDEAGRASPLMAWRRVP